MKEIEDKEKQHNRHTHTRENTKDIRFWSKNSKEWYDEKWENYDNVLWQTSFSSSSSSNNNSKKKLCYEFGWIGYETFYYI